MTALFLYFHKRRMKNTQRQANRHLLEQRTTRLHLNVVLTILAHLQRRHGAPKLLVDHLQPVAYAQHRHTQIEHLRIVDGRIVRVHRTGSARNNDAAVTGCA